MIQKTVYKVADFISWQKAKSLILSPKFQRRAVWKSGAKSYLIDTILKDYPVPIIFLRDLGTDPKSFEPRREVVDGQQRLRTILSFIAPSLLPDYDPGRDDFKISRSHNKELANKTFEKMDPLSQQAILNYQFSVHLFPQSMDDREVIEIFRRLNSSNYTLNKQELRNAEFFGEFKSTALRLSAEQLHRWREWNTFSENDISRMTEVELTSECLLSILDQKLGGRLATRLDAAYEEFDDSLPNREEIERRFRIAMDVISNKLFPAHPKSPLLKKRLIYTQIMAVVDAMFGLKSTLSKQVPMRDIGPSAIAKWRVLSDSLASRSVPLEVLEAIDRRTNDLKERKTLFTYIRAGF